MRYFPFRILALCILLPPLLYLGSVKWVEYGFSITYKKQIEKLHAEDMPRLLDGSAALEETLSESIEAFLDNRHAFEKKIKVVVTILTKQGHLLYPSDPDDRHTDFPGHRDPLLLAEQNYRILNDGLDVRVSVTVSPNSLLSYLILSVFVLFSIGILYVVYKKGVEKAKLESEVHESRLTVMLEREEQYRDKLETLSDDRKELETRLNDMKYKLVEVRQSEDGLIEEIVKLEKMIEENAKLQRLQNEEIESLKSMLEKSGGEKKARLKQKIKGQDTTEKRFRTLYKNLAFHEKAIDGFRDFEDDMKLKCEEVIHLLNSEPDKVNIKRKVFGKKNRETVFEVIFSYNGRLYFRKLKDGTIEILAVGTKNTQDRELEFLNRL